MSEIDTRSHVLGADLRRNMLIQVSIPTADGPMTTWLKVLNVMSQHPSLADGQIICQGVVPRPQGSKFGENMFAPIPHKFLTTTDARHTRR